MHNSMMRRNGGANGLRRRSSLVRRMTHALKFAQEAPGECSCNVIPKMVSKLPRASKVTSQQIGQVANSMISAE
jgi:hypothetical protein